MIDTAPIRGGYCRIVLIDRRIIEDVLLFGLEILPVQTVSLFDQPLGLPAILILAVGVALALAGRKLVKILIILAGGIIGAALGYTLVGSQFAGVFPFLGAIVGFIVVGLIAYWLAFLAFGLVIAGLGFYLTRIFVPNTLIALIVAVIGLIIGILLFNYFLSTATAIGGGLMAWYGLNILGLLGAFAFAAGVALMIIGAWVQLSQLETSQEPSSPPSEAK